MDGETKGLNIDGWIYSIRVYFSYTVSLEMSCLYAWSFINQSIKICIAPLKHPYSETLPTQAKRKRKS